MARGRATARRRKYAPVPGRATRKAAHGKWPAASSFGEAQGAPPSLREMIRVIAGPGGFLGRKSDGEPGTRTLRRGPRRADDFAIAFRGFREACTLPD